MITKRLPTSLRRLLQALLALAVVMAPVSANAMERLGALASSHHQMVEGAEHCAEAPVKSAKHDQGDGKSCCASMCMGIAVAPQGTATRSDAVRTTASFAAPSFRIGSHLELSTPPPRRA